MVNYEDLILKSIVSEYPQEFIDFFLNISCKFLRFAPTEMVETSSQNRFADTVLEMENGIYINLEFMSTSIVYDDMARFLQYSAHIYRKSKSLVETYIISSANVKYGKIKHQFSLNDYFNPHIIYLKDFDYEEIINNIKYKLKINNQLNAMDIVKFLLTPLMVKRNELEELIEEIMDIFVKMNMDNVGINPNDWWNIYDVLCGFSDKFIVDLNKKRNVKEKFSMISDKVIKMRQESYNSGVNEGMEKGIEKGMEKGMDVLTSKLKFAKELLSKGCSRKDVLDKTGLSEKHLDLLKK